MLREFSADKRHISLNVVGMGDVISIFYGVLSNWELRDIGLEGLYELDFDTHMAVKYHNMPQNRSWYKICKNSNDQPILLRISEN